jgi:hypothetical protein
VYAAGLVNGHGAGFAAGVRSCGQKDNDTHDEEDGNLPLLTETPPPPPPPPPPSPLLALLEHLPDLFTKEVLARLTPTDRAVFGRASLACRAVVQSLDLASGLPFPRKKRPSPSHLAPRLNSPSVEASNFVACFELSVWAVANGCT